MVFLSKIWGRNCHLLVLYELKPGEELTEVYGLPSRFFSDMANYIGAFIQYDVKNIWSLDMPYMRIRTALKKCKKVRKPSGDWIVCNFKYEKLPSFCFLCGLIEHIDKFFQLPENELLKGWDVSLRAPNRRVAMYDGER